MRNKRQKSLDGNKTEAAENKFDSPPVQSKDGAMIARKYSIAIMVAVACLVGLVVDRYFLTSSHIGRVYDASSDFDQIYEVVFSKVLNTHQGEFVSVALGRNFTNDVETFTPLPAGLYHRLEIVWSHKGVRLDLLIPPNRINAIWERFEDNGHHMSRFQQYEDVKTQKPIRVYLIDSVCWLGSDEVLVGWSATHANLDAVGGKIRLKCESGLWHVVEETDKWVS